MHSTPEVKQAFMDACDAGLLLDEHGNERENYDIMLRFGQAPFCDVADWLIEYKAQQEAEQQQQEQQQQ